MNKAAFSKLRDLQPVTMMIRHAERFPIRNWQNPQDALLTEQGKEDAYRYGTLAAVLSPLTLLHSPVERCHQTAENIVRGIEESGGTAVIAGVHDALGGPYTLQGFKEIPDLLGQYGLEKFLRMWFNGTLPKGHLMPLEEAAKIELSCIRETSRAYDTSLFLVTHDWNIMILREYLLHLPHEEVGYPDFLDGITYYRSGDKELMFAHQIDDSKQVVL